MGMPVAIIFITQRVLLQLTEIQCRYCASQTVNVTSEVVCQFPSSQAVNVACDIPRRPNFSRLSRGCDLCAIRICAAIDELDHSTASPPSCECEYICFATVTFLHARISMTGCLSLWIPRLTVPLALGGSTAHNYANATAAESCI